MKKILKLALVASFLIPSICMGSSNEEEFGISRQNQSSEDQAAAAKRSKKFAELYKESCHFLRNLKNQQELARNLLKYYDLDPLEQKKQGVLTLVFEDPTEEGKEMTFYCCPPPLHSRNEVRDNLEQQKALVKMLRDGIIHITPNNKHFHIYNPYSESSKGWALSEGKPPFFLQGMVINSPTCAVDMSVWTTTCSHGASFSQILYAIPLVPAKQTVEGISMGADLLNLLCTFKNSTFSFSKQDLLGSLKLGGRKLNRGQCLMKIKLITDAQYDLNWDIYKVTIKSDLKEEEGEEDEEEELIVDEDEGLILEDEKSREQVSLIFRNVTLGRDQGANITGEFSGIFEDVSPKKSRPIVRTYLHVFDNGLNSRKQYQVDLIPSDKQALVDAWKVQWGQSLEVKSNFEERFTYLTGDGKLYYDGERDKDRTKYLINLFYNLERK